MARIPAPRADSNHVLHPHPSREPDRKADDCAEQRTGPSMRPPCQRAGDGAQQQAGTAEHQRDQDEIGGIVEDADVGQLLPLLASAAMFRCAAGRARPLSSVARKALDSSRRRGSRHRPAAQPAAHRASLDRPGPTGDDFDDHASISCPACHGRVVVHILVGWGGLDRKDARAGTWPQKVKDVSGSAIAQEKVIPFRAGAVTVSDDLELQ